MRKLILFSLVLCIAVLSSWLLVSTAATPNRITRVSIATDGTQADNFSYAPATTSTGRYVAFASLFKYQAGDTNSLWDIYLRDRDTDGNGIYDETNLVSTTLVSLDYLNTSPIGASRSFKPSVSGDGKLIAFVTEAANITGPASDTDGFRDVFLRRRDPVDTILISQSTGGTRGNNDSDTPSVAADGGHVAFFSVATNLVTGDGNNKGDVFLRTLPAGPTVIISKSSFLSGDAIGNDLSDSPSVSADGKYIAFRSLASNLVDNDTNGLSDVFLRDLTGGAGKEVTICVSTNFSKSNAANLKSDSPAISADGRYVVYRSLATDLTLVPADGSHSNIYLFDRVTRTNLLVSKQYDGNFGANGDCDQPAISRNGRYITYSSLASNLISGDTNTMRNIYMYDRQTAITTRVSRGITDVTVDANGPSAAPAVSGDGNSIAFESDATNLVANDSNTKSDVFVFDRVLPEALITNPIRVSVTFDGTQGEQHSYRPSISADAKIVAFESDATDLVPDDTQTTCWGGSSYDSNCRDVFVKDLNAASNQITRISVANGTGAQGNGASFKPSISDDGQWIAFVSDANNFLPDGYLLTGGVIATDGNNKCNIKNPEVFADNCPDIFLRHRASGKTIPISVNYYPFPANRNTGNGKSDNPSINAAGNMIAYDSQADDLVDEITRLAAREPNAVSASDRIVRIFRATYTSGVPDTVDTIIVSKNSSGALANGNSRKPSISADGRYVAFESYATNLVDGDNNGMQDIFVRDVTGSLTTVVSISSGGGGAFGNRNSSNAAISGDGNFVVFQSGSTNLVPSVGTSGASHIYLYNRTNGILEIISKSPEGVQGDGDSVEPQISYDGRFVVFRSSALNLIRGGMPESLRGQSNVFLFDRILTGGGGMYCISKTWENNWADSGSLLPTRPVFPTATPYRAYIAYQSFATNLVPNDTNYYSDIFLHWSLHYKVFLPFLFY